MFLFKKLLFNFYLLPMDFLVYSLPIFRPYVQVNDTLDRSKSYFLFLFFLTKPLIYLLRLNLELYYCALGKHHMAIGNSLIIWGSLVMYYRIFVCQMVFDPA